MKLWKPEESPTCMYNSRGLVATYVGKVDAPHTERARAQFFKGTFKQQGMGHRFRPRSSWLAAACCRCRRPPGAPQRCCHRLAAAHWSLLTADSAGSAGTCVVLHMPPAVKPPPRSGRGIQQRVADGRRAQAGVHPIRLRVLPVLARRSVEREVGGSRQHRFMAWTGGRQCQGLGGGFAT